MITGIGTPSSQSSIPRPMFASFEFLNREKNAKPNVEFLRRERKTFPEYWNQNQPKAGSRGRSRASISSA